MTDPAKLGVLLADLAEAWIGAEHRRLETMEQALIRFRAGLDRLAQATPPAPPPAPQADDKRLLLDQKALRELVLYSPAHIARLEQAGRFPKRIRLGDGARARVAWSKDAVMAWIDEKKPG